MSGFRLVCCAGSLAALAVPAFAGSKPHAVLGRDLSEACGIDTSADYCAGFVEALRIQNGDRFLRRNCPPALVRGKSAHVQEVRDYLHAHRLPKGRLARDVVFDAETSQLSQLLGQNCHEN